MNTFQHCERQIAVTKIAPHLEKCMGKGRSSGRAARARRVDYTFSKCGLTCMLPPLFISPAPWIANTAGSTTAKVLTLSTVSLRTILRAGSVRCLLSILSSFSRRSHFTHVSPTARKKARKPPLAAAATAAVAASNVINPSPDNVRPRCLA